MTKRHLLLVGLLCILAAWRAEAQFTPQGFSYQCIVRDANGASLGNQTVTLLFTVRSGAANGPVAYSEKQTASTNEFGLVNLVVGAGTALQGTFSNINWGGGSKFLTVSVETSPNVFDELGTTQLMSVPYALYAQNGGTGDNWGAQTVQTSPTLSGNGTSGSPLALAQQGAQNGQVLKWNGSTWVPGNDNAGQNGTVTEINTGAGLTGGPITSTGTISLANTAVTPGSYGSGTQIPVITVDQYGRVTDVSTVTVPPPSLGITGATGINVTQNGLNFVITNTGDTNAADDITTSSQADGDVSGPFSNLQIKANAVGSPEIADNAVSNSELAENAVNTAEINDGAVTAAKLNSMGASSGQVLKWNGTEWVPAADALGVTNISAGAGINVTGGSNNFTITNTGDTDPTNDLTTSSVANGDITGPFSNLQIKPEVVGASELTTNAVTTVKISDKAVTGDKIDQMSAATGQVLKWNGTTWAPAPDIVGTVTITGGVGIDVIASGNNFTIANNGDINPFDDITETSQAGGDISGTFDNLQIKQSVVTSFELANNAVSTAKIQDKAVEGVKIAQMSALNGQVLKWNGTTWAPAADVTGVGDNWGAQTAVTGTTISGNGTVADPLIIAQQGATTGQVLKWNGTTWLPAADNWGLQVAVPGPTITGNGTVASPLNIAQQGATSGQVLKWNGTTWAPANEAGGDNWGTQTAATSLELEGNGTGGNPLRLADGTTTGQVLKFNTASSLWLPADDTWGTQAAATNATLSGNGAAGTPLGIAQQGASSGQVLKWNGTTWAPAADNDSGGDNWGTQTAFTSLELSGNGTGGNPLRLADGTTTGQVLKFNTASSLWLPADDTWGTQTAATNATLSGNGTAGTPLGIAQQGASSGQVLKWNGTTWAPAADNDSGGDDWGTQTALTGPTLIGNGTTGNELGIAPQGASIGQVLKFNGTTWVPEDDNIGAGPADNWGTQVAITNATLEGDGTAGNPLGIAQQGASTDQVLKWNGTTWAPADEAGPDNWGTQTAFTSLELDGDGTAGDPLRLADGTAVGQVLKFNGTLWLPGVDLTDLNTYAAGPGISVTGTAPNFTITNTGDLDVTNEIQTLSLAGNALSLSKGGGTVNLPPSNSYTAGTGISVTGTAPNFVINNTGDADNNPANELQTISLSGNDLTLSNGGGTVTLPSGGGNNYSAGTGINITGTAPNFTIVNAGDNDNDAANELQNLSLNGKILTISGTNSMVNFDTIVTSAGINLWTGAGIDIHNSNTGNVGIGLNNPQTKLHVKGNGESLRLEGLVPTLGFATNGKPGAELSHTAGSALSMFALDSSSIVFGTAGGKTLTVDGITGNVGVGGLNSGNARLKVMHDNTVGGLMIENTAGPFWEFRVDAGTGGLALYNNFLGAVPAGTFAPNGVYTPSDRRLKKDILPVSTVLNRVMQLEPVHYRYNPEKSSSKASLGFIAQDVNVQFPELVGTATADDGTQYLSVNYAGFGVLAIKAIQEQQAQIDALKQANSDLLSRLEALEARIQGVEKAGGSASAKK